MLFWYGCTSDCCCKYTFCLCRTGDQLQLAFHWMLRLAKPTLYFKEDSVMAELLKLCPVLYQDYAPPLVSFNGGMHMVLSVGMYSSDAFKRVMLYLLLRSNMSCCTSCCNLNGACNLFGRRLSCLLATLACNMQPTRQATGSQAAHALICSHPPAFKAAGSEPQSTMHISKSDLVILPCRCVKLAMFVRECA